MPEHLLEMKEISKSFGAVKALNKVDLELGYNEVLGLVGDNAAGKSTLMKVLSGVYQADEGEIYIEGEKVNIRNPRDARKLGIEMIYQDLALVPIQDVVTNVFMGREITSKLGIIDRKKMLNMATEFFKSHFIFDLPNIKTDVINLSGGQQQAVAVVRAFIHKPRILIMDEPTAVLSVSSSQKFADYVEILKKKGGFSSIFISHKLPEVFRVSDRIMILRHGKGVVARPIDEITIDETVKLIVGA